MLIQKKANLHTNGLVRCVRPTYGDRLRSPRYFGQQGASHELATVAWTVDKDFVSTRKLSSLSPAYAQKRRVGRETGWVTSRPLDVTATPAQTL